MFLPGEQWNPLPCHNKRDFLSTSFGRRSYRWCEGGPTSNWFPQAVAHILQFRFLFIVWPENILSACWLPLCAPFLPLTGRKCTKFVWNVSKRRPGACTGN